MAVTVAREEGRSWTFGVTCDRKVSVHYSLRHTPLNRVKKKKYKSTHKKKSRKNSWK